MGTAPRSWEELRELLGEEAARRVVERFGGEQVTVPRAAHPDHRLASAIGDRRLFEEMSWRWGGCKIYVPEMASALRAIRNERIRERKARGASNREIAREEGLSVRQVRNIVLAGRQ